MPLVEWLNQQDEVLIWSEKLVSNDLKVLRPDLIISYSYKFLIQKDVLDLLPGKFINLHISLLPYNRGADPNIWSILEDTPKGCTIHLIDNGIDTGPILFQREVCFDFTNDTLESSYQFIQEQIQDLFIQNWLAIKNGNYVPLTQTAKGSYHHLGEFAAIKNSLLGSEGWTIKLSIFKDRYYRLSNTD